MSNKSTRDIYQDITNRIIAELERGTIPWRCPWRPDEWRHRNLISQKPYRGINVILLSSMPYESPFWLTANQLRKLGGNLLPHMKPTTIVFWRYFCIDESDNGELKSRGIPFLREYQVYNLEQTIGIPPKHIPVLKPRNQLEFQPLENAERIIANFIDSPPVFHGGDAAYYSPRQDHIQLPYRSKFNSEDTYYSVRFHESVHATGHPKRLNRPNFMITDFGSVDYSKEELVAEIGAAFLCAQSGIANGTLKDSAAYIANWLQVLKNDRKLIIQASAAAEKAVNYILNQKAGPEELAA